MTTALARSDSLSLTGGVGRHDADARLWPAATPPAVPAARTCSPSVTPLRTPDKVLESGSWCLENGHRAVLKLSGGRFPKRLIGMKPIELHTVGRKSGLRRSTMLTAPIFEVDRVVIVASKGGHSGHPDWYRNLAANPDIEITADGKTTAFTAHTASADEKAELWPVVTSAYKGYDGYQRNTERDIPVVICTPAGTN